jgi:hypothetical protein
MGIYMPCTVMGLKEQMKLFANEVEPIFTELSEIAAYHEQLAQNLGGNVSHYAENFQRIFEGVKQDTFKLVIVGRFGNGKLTLLDALLGRLPDDTLEQVKDVFQWIEEQKERLLHNSKDDGGKDEEAAYKPEPGEKGPSSASDESMVPILTLIYYADEPRVRLQTKSGEWQEKTLESYLIEVEAKNSQKENKKISADILQLHVGLPAPICRSGITLINLSGIENSEEHNQLVNETLVQSDAAIMLFRSDSLLTTEERRFVTKMRALGMKHCFNLINLWQGREVDHELRAHTWERLVRGLRNGLPYDGQSEDDFAAYDIYFVDVLKALDGRLTGNNKHIEASGMANFERRLNMFLREECLAVHNERFCKDAERNILGLQSLLNKRLPLLSADSARFEERLKHYQPQLQELRKRAKKLDTIFRIHLRNCQEELVSDYEHLMNTICQQLPDVMAQRHLPGLEGTGKKLMANFKSKQLLGEAFQMARDYVRGEVEAWQSADRERRGPQRIISEHIENLMRDITAEIKQIEKKYDEIRFALSGAQAEVENAELKGPGLAERVVSVALGLALGAVDVAIAGGAGGLKHAGRYAAGAIAVGVPLALIGAPLLPVVVPISIITGLVTNALWGAQSLEKEIKKRVVDLMINGDAQQGMHGLHELHHRNRSELDRAVLEVFSNIQVKVEHEVERYVQEEEWNIQSSERQCALDLHERWIQRKRIEEGLARLSELRAELREVRGTLRKG